MCVPAGGAATDVDGNGAAAPNGAGAGADGGEADGEADVSPPYAVMEHFPMAVLTNALLNALNELRHCALMSLCKPMAGWVWVPCAALCCGAVCRAVLCCGALGRP